MDQVKVTITLEGFAEAIPGALRVLLGQAEQTTDTAAGPVDPSEDESIHRTPWTSAEVGKVWNEIAIGAKCALAEIAKRPDGYPKSELYEALKVDGKTLGGQLSSVGAAVTRLGFYDKTKKIGKEWLWTYNGAKYGMQADVAQIIGKLEEVTL